MRLLIGGIAIMLTTVLCGQTENPFELRYKTGKPPFKADTSIKPESTEPDPPSREMEVIRTSPEVIDSVKTTDSVVVSDSILGQIATDPSQDGVEEDISRKIDVEQIDPPAVSRTPSPPVPNVGVVLILTMLGLSLLVLTWAVNMNRGFIRMIFRAAMNENLSALLLREQKFTSLQYLYYIVYAVFFMNASLFVFLMSRFAHWDFGHRQSPMIAILGVLLAIYLTRHVFMKFVGDTFSISNETTHYSFNILLYNILAGVTLIPINLFLAFGPPGMRMSVIYFGLGLVGLLYLLRQLRGLNIAGHIISQNVFQFFVYLCAVEILPVLVLFKYFITN